jgi:hypothetical protein
MKYSLRQYALFAIAGLATLSTVGCAINPDANKRSSQSQTTCAESKKDFTPAAGSQTGLFLSELPAGVYTHTTADVFYESKTTLFDTTVRIARTHLLATPKGVISANQFESSIRCLETSNGFSSYSEPVPILADFTKYNSDARGYDILLNNYSLNFLSETQPALVKSEGASNRSADAGTVASTIGGYWNAGYQFVRRSGDIYEFYGTRYEGSRTYLGKAVFVRTNLPANSQ